MAKLIVSPQSIVVPAPATTGSGTVTWDTEVRTTLGAVWEKIDSNPELQFDPPSGLATSGSAIPFTLDVGQTAVFTLKDKDEIPLIPSVTVKAVRPGGSGSGLGDFATTVQNGLNQIYQIGNFQIVSGVTVIPGPTSVRIKFTTAFPTIPIVEVFRKLSNHPSADMTVANRAAESFPVFGGNQTSHDARLTGLDQDSPFWYRITAYGGPIDGPSIVTDHFVTGRRRATLFIDEIKVFNSGDNFGGEMAFQLAVYDADKEVMLGNQHRHPDADEEDVKSGGSIGLPFGSPVEVIEKAPDNIGIYVSGWDRDYNPFGPEWGIHARGEQLPRDSIPGDGHGEDDYYTWAVLTFPVALPDFATSIPLDIDPGNWGVHFTMLGRIDVQILLPKNVYETPSVILHDRVTHMARSLWIGDIKTGVQFVTLGPGGTVFRRVDNRGGGRPRRSIWKEIGGPRLPDGFTVVSSPLGRVDLFGRTRNNRVAHAIWNIKGDGEQIEWSDLGGEVAGGINVIRSSDALNLFAIGKNGAAVHAKIDSNRKTSREAKWQNLGGKFCGHLAAVASLKGPLHLFGTNEHGAAFHSLVSRDGGPAGAGRWTSLGGEFATSIVAQPTSRGVVAFGVDRSRTLFGKSWDGRKWTPSGEKWLQLGGVDSFSVPRRLKSVPPKKTRKKK